MARKRKKASGKPFCYYCGRGFPDEKVLIQHQRARHFKCKKCYKKMSTAHALMNHMYQVHKETMKKVQNAKEGRDSIELAIYGMNGVPQDVIDQRNEREAKKGSDDESSENSAESEEESEGEDDVKEEAPPPRPRTEPSAPTPPTVVQPPQPPQFNGMMMGMRPPMPMPMPGYFPPPPMGMPPMLGRGLPLPSIPPNHPMSMMGRGMHMPIMDAPPPPPTGAPPSLPSFPPLMQSPPQTTFSQPPSFAQQRRSRSPSPSRVAASGSVPPSNPSTYTGGRTGPVEGEEVDKKGNIRVLYVYKDELSMEEKRALLPRYRVDDMITLSQSISARLKEVQGRR